MSLTVPNLDWFKGCDGLSEASILLAVRLILGVDRPNWIQASQSKFHDELAAILDDQ